MPYTDGYFSFTTDQDGNPILMVDSVNAAGAYSMGKYSFTPDEDGRPILRVIDLGGGSGGDPSAAIATHNVSTDSHSDIREDIGEVGQAIFTTISAHNADLGTHTDIRNKIKNLQRADKFYNNNMLINPDFTDYTGADSVSDWDVYGGGIGIASGTNYTDELFTAYKSIRFNVSGQVVDQGFGFRQVIPVISGKTYTFQFYYKSDNPSSIDQGAYAYVSYRNGDDEVVFNQNIQITETIDSIWRLKTVSIPVSGDIASLNVGFGCYRNGDIYFAKPEFFISNDILENFYIDLSKHNVGIGSNVLPVTTDGEGNICIGTNAGKEATNGLNLNPSNSIYIGKNTRSQSEIVGGHSNEIVIGESATGKGDNTIVIGNGTTKDFYTYARIHKGVEQSMVSGTMFTQIADKQVTNTLVETSLLGSGVGSRAVPGGDQLKPGQTIRIRIKGGFSALAGEAPTIKFKIGNTIILSNTAEIAVGATDALFEICFTMTLRTGGTNGTIIGEGHTMISSGQGFTTSTMRQLYMTDAVAINNMYGGLIDVTYTWETASASNIITSKVATIEILN